ncbi:putative phage abortive infection protein [Serratia fonticola]|uniref:putative phage abortive infection protein n=1 Tax=Serratia fonticola TaxID=47917 RepID=UPI000BA26763|nr:putative phage abortive infection protein [Serratia fonticola]PAA97740.1 hypothetical protein CJJ13_08935 [Serratia fonticola]
MKTAVYPLAIILVFFIIISLCGVYASWIGVELFGMSAKSPEQRGVMGDSWGMFTSIFSALGFGGLLITLVLQSKSLKEAQKDADIQKESIALQQFEDVFFRMMSIHTSIINDLDLRNKKNKTEISSGRDTFISFYREFIGEYNKNKMMIDLNNSVGKLLHVNDAFTTFAIHNSELQKEDMDIYDERNIIGFSFECFWVKHRADLGHYFRFLFNIYKFIDDSNLSESQKYSYARILRAQISDYELLILFYNCLSFYGFERFKPYAEKYMIFNNLPFALLIIDEHASLYESSAFGGRIDKNIMILNPEANYWRKF